MDSYADGEQRRARLRQRLDDVLGEEEADTLMTQRPPVDWSQLTTKDDLAQLHVQLRAEMQSEVAALRSDMTAEMARWGRAHVYTTVVAVLASTSLAFAAAGLS